MLILFLFANFKHHYLKVLFRLHSYFYFFAWVPFFCLAYLLQCWFYFVNLCFKSSFSMGIFFNTFLPVQQLSSCLSCTRSCVIMLIKRFNLCSEVGNAVITLNSCRVLGSNVGHVQALSYMNTETQSLLFTFGCNPDKDFLFFYRPWKTSVLLMNRIALSHVLKIVTHYFSLFK